tara:strand:- start:4421 stop:6577 length:2157 start_codon:yes stop_codon:yes gene_type:complete
MGGVKTISIIVAANIKGLETGLGKANKSIAGFASKAARLGSMLSFGVTAPLVAMGKQAFDTFSNFENAMMKVNTVTGASVEEFKMLTEEAKRLGATTQFTASQVADLQLVLGRKGFDPTAIKEMEGSILDLALATGEDLSLAADTVASSINAFGLQTDDAASVANTLASAAANSSIQLSTFSTAFGHAGASAKAVGVDIEELSAMMGVLMDNGIKASKAGTGLRKTFMKLNEEGIPFKQTLNALSDGSMTLNQAQGMVGTTAANQLLILSQNREKIAELTNEYDNNTTRLSEMAEAMGNTTFAKVKKMQSAIEGLKLEMGALIADMITPLIHKITQLANKFSGLDSETQKSIIKFAAVAAAIGPVLIAVGALTGLFGNLFLAVKKVATTGFTLFTNPIGIVVGLVAALSAGVLYLIGNWDTFILKVAESSGPIQTLITGVLKGVAGFAGYNAKLQGSILAIEVLSNEIKNGDFTPPDAEWKSFGDTIKDLVSEVSGFDLDILGDLFKPGGSGEGEESESGGPQTRSLQEAYDAIFGAGAWEAYQEDIRLKEQQLANTQRWKDSLQQLAVGISSSFAQSFADVIMSGGNLLQGLGDIFKSLLKQIASMIIKALVLSAILSFTGLGGSQSAIKAFGTDQSFSGLLGGMMGGAFAEGGQPPLGKISLIGEAGPELFVPNQKGTIIPNEAFGGGGAVIPDVRITGDDLLIVFDKAQRRKSRR